MARFKVRLTGISAFGAGLQWDVRPSDAEIARGVLAYLEDRRILWEDVDYELPHECIASAEKTRDYLTSAIQTAGIGQDLAHLLAETRQLFTSFETQERHHGIRHGRAYGPDELSLALGALRAAVGDRLAELASEYDLPVGPNLRSVVPESGRFLFEALGDSA